MKTFEGSLTDHDTAVDNDNIPLVIESDRGDELDTKLYKNKDPLSPLHLACRFPKCAGCPGCGTGKTTKAIRVGVRDRRFRSLRLMPLNCFLRL